MQTFNVMNMTPFVLAEVSAAPLRRNESGRRGGARPCALCRPAAHGSTARQEDAFGLAGRIMPLSGSTHGGTARQEDVFGLAGRIMPLSGSTHGGTARQEDAFGLAVRLMLLSGSTHGGTAAHPYEFSGTEARPLAEQANHPFNTNTTIMNFPFSKGENDAIRRHFGRHPLYEKLEEALTDLLLEDYEYGLSLPEAFAEEVCLLDSLRTCPDDADRAARRLCLTCKEDLLTLHSGRGGTRQMKRALGCLMRTTECLLYSLHNEKSDRVARSIGRTMQTLGLTGPDPACTEADSSMSRTEEWMQCLWENESTLLDEVERVVAEAHPAAQGPGGGGGPQMQNCTIYAGHSTHNDHERHISFSN